MGTEIPSQGRRWDGCHLFLFQFCSDALAASPLLLRSCGLYLVPGRLAWQGWEQCGTKALYAVQDKYVAPRGTGTFRVILSTRHAHPCHAHLLRALRSMSSICLGTSTGK